MVATQETGNAGFVARLNESLDGVKDVPRARGRRVALAKMMGMSGESARKWLAGETLPTMDNARQFAAKAGVQVDWLLTGRGSKLPTTTEATAEIQTTPTAPPVTASGRIEAMPEPSLPDLLDALSARLEQADPAVRQEVAQLVMRYMENPEAGARIAAAIELLLGKPNQ